MDETPIVKRMCSRCGINKRLDRFERVKNRGRFSAVCRKCRRKERRAKEREFRTYGDEDVRCNSTRARDRYSANKRAALAYRGWYCCGCDYSKGVPCLQFHHVDSSKKEHTINCANSFEANQDELDKCVILCSRCHDEYEHGIPVENPEKLSAAIAAVNVLSEKTKIREQVKEKQALLSKRKAEGENVDQERRKCEADIAFLDSDIKRYKYRDSIPNLIDRYHERREISRLEDLCMELEYFVWKKEKRGKQVTEFKERLDRSSKELEKLKYTADARREFPLGTVYSLSDYIKRPKMVDCTPKKMIEPPQNAWRMREIRARTTSGVFKATSEDLALKARAKSDLALLYEVMGMSETKNHVTAKKCPFCPSSDAFEVGPNRNHPNEYKFNCYSCGLGGDVFFALKTIRGLEFGPAMNEMYRRYANPEGDDF